MCSRRGQVTFAAIHKWSETPYGDELLCVGGSLGPQATAPDLPCGRSGAPSLWLGRDFAVRRSRALLKPSNLTERLAEGSLGWGGHVLLCLSPKRLSALCKRGEWFGDS